MILSLSHSSSISFHFKTLASNSSRPQLPPSPPPPKSVVRFKNPNTKQPLKPHLRRTSHPKAEAVAKSAIKRISDKLRSLGYLQPEDDPSTAADHRPPTGPGSPGEIFIPTPQAIPKNRVGCTLDPSWSTPEHPVPEPGSGASITRLHGLWRREKEIAASKRAMGKVEAAPTVAELTIPPAELKRLRGEGIRLDKRLKVGKAGITEGIVNGIHERWRRLEVVKLKCEDLCRINMKRTHEILERKTGGLVIWRSGSVIILYRGANYKYPYFHKDERTQNHNEASSNPINDDPSAEADLLIPPGNPSAESPHTRAPSSLVVGVGSPTKVRPKLEGETQLEEESDRLLDGLGPRFTDWWGCDPLPVDADALPARVPGFRKPFRLLPFGIEPKLTDREMTILRRLNRPLPCHFVLGRNRNLQGLALSMIKLWEKCEIAKIAVKRGVQNTSSEIMAEELKHLTGGTILSRDRDFIVFYRGKDYLPSSVSNAIVKRRNSLMNQQKQNKEKTCPLAATENIDSKLPVIVPLEEPENKIKQNKLTAPNKRVTSERTLLSLEDKLFQAMEKKKEAEKLLKELEEKAVPSEELDKEGISEEERYMLRKVGLRMQPFLLLGRRGVFDGTIENMHLHWKYRELVKIISKDRCIEDVESAARILEAESGGILVAVERVSKGHAIIVYRGKNYKRPATLRPTTLLNKKEAMKRSLEVQRRESLKLNVLSISRNIERIKNQMTRALLIDDKTIKSEKNGISEASDENTLTSEETGDSVEYKEVHQSDLESSHLEVYNEHMPKENNDVPHKSVQVELESSKHNVKFFDGNLEQPFSDQSRTSLLDSDKKCASNESHSHPHISVKEAASSSSVNNIDKYFEDGEMPSLAKEDRDDSPSDKAKPEDETLVDFTSRAALSNRERLILRKQALKTTKRPVLSVGRNNVISGVAKTIKTHFKKHPLAIVNIKGRAEGTSVQELIFQLEQATGAVLVSRELNKVILYRGWGAGEIPGEKKGNEAKASERFNKATSSRLMDAIRLECGLQPELKTEHGTMA